MTSTQQRTFLRIGTEVFPVYGDVWRGFSPVAADLRDLGVESLCVYASLALTLLSGFHSIWHAARFMDQPA